jgi:hypothetical protein
MGKRLTYQEKIDQSVIDLINELFKIAGHTITYDDVKDRKDRWFTEYTITEKQYDKWKNFGVKYLMKKLDMTELKAQKEMAMFALMYNLKFSE